MSMRLLAALAASAAVHALVIAVLAALGAWAPVVARVQRVEVAPLSAEAWEANRAVASPGAATRAPSPPPGVVPADAPRPDGVVVAVAPSPERGPPKETRLLADRDNRVEHETRALDAGQWENVLARATPGRIAAPRAGEEGDSDRAKRGPDAEPGVARTEVDRERESARAARPGVASAPGGELAAAREAGGGTPAPGTPDAGSRLAGRLPTNLLPTAGVLDLVAGGPREMDLPGVAEGDATYLNTRRYRYAGYFERIRAGITGHYDPVRAFDLRDPERRVYGLKDRKTTVWFALDAGGRLKDVRLVKSCGLDFLDQEALRAVREAAPFPNPPAGLVKDGQIEYGNLSFVHGPWLRGERVSRTQSSVGP